MVIEHCCREVVAVVVVTKTCCNEDLVIKSYRQITFTIVQIFTPFSDIYN